MNTTTLAAVPYLDFTALRETYDIDEGYSNEAVEAFIECFSEEDLGQLNDCYQGEYSSDEYFAQEMAVSLGAIPSTTSQWPNYCIDWEYAARELMYDYCSHNGHYFYNF